MTSHRKQGARPAARNPEDRECGRGFDTSQPWKGTPYLKAGVRLEAADAGSITRESQRCSAKINIGWPWDDRAMQRGAFIAEGALIEPGHEGRVPSNLPLGRGVRLNPGTHLRRTGTVALHTPVLEREARIDTSPRAGGLSLHLNDVVLTSVWRLPFASGVLVETRPFCRPGLVCRRMVCLESGRPQGAGQSGLLSAGFATDPLPALC